MTLSRKRKNMLITVICTIVTAVLILLLISPFYFMVTNAFKTGPELARTVPTLIPHMPTLENFQELSTDRTFIRGMINSLQIAFITMIVAITIAIPSAYSFLRLPRKAAGAMQWWILLSQMIPGIILVVPLFRILLSFQLTNTHAGLIIVYAVASLPFSIWMMRGFIAGVPPDIEDAAFIDGCSLPKMFFYVLLPTILPGVLTGGVFAFIVAWNELFFALCLIQSPDLRTLPIHLQSFVGMGGQAREGMVMAGAVVASLPGLIVFLIFQRFFVTGLTSGSVK